MEAADKVELGVYELKLTEEGQRWWRGDKGVLVGLKNRYDAMWTTADLANSVFNNS